MQERGAVLCGDRSFGLRRSIFFEALEQVQRNPLRFTTLNRTWRFMDRKSRVLSPSIGYNL